ncbi:MAG: class I SAM-dependent methyltransferase [Planctomycetota bacterium]
MPEPDYLKPYQDALREHGPGFEATLWRNEEYQAKRFAVIADLLGDPLGQIADMGCGRADLLVHLVTIGCGFKRYVGIEGVPEMLAHCQEQYGDRRDCAWLTADFVADEDLFKTVAADGVDTFVFSGSLNTMSEATAIEVVRRASASGRVVFNFLSTELYEQPDGPDGPVPGDPANRFDKATILAACRGFGDVKTREGYLPSFDVTVRIV